MPHLAYLAASISLAALVVGLWIGHSLTKAHYKQQLAVIEATAQLQKEHADEVARQLARSLAQRHTLNATHQQEAVQYRRSVAGRTGCLDADGVRLTNKALAPSR